MAEEITPLGWTILNVLAGQSEGYLCSPVSAAFYSVGLFDPEESEKELIELQNKGLVEFYTAQEETTFLKAERDDNGMYVLDEDQQFIPIINEKTGKPETESVTQVVDAGWIITEKGREWLR
jgi:hypothetical protein